MRILILLLLVGCASNYRKPTITVPPKPVNKTEILYTNSSYQWLKDAVRVTNCVMNLKDFQDEVKLIKKFDYSDHNGKQVIKNLLKVKVKVTTYKSKIPWSKAVAYTKRDINLNIRRNPRAMPSMVNNLVHEPLHKAGYSHGSNSSAGKENSVNYKIGKSSEKHVPNCL